jgi:hypothetical protein
VALTLLLLKLVTDTFRHLLGLGELPRNLGASRLHVGAGA